jgi:hypothetical protein
MMNRYLSTTNFCGARAVVCVALLAGGMAGCGGGTSVSSGSSGGGGGGTVPTPQGPPSFNVASLTVPSPTGTSNNGFFIVTNNTTGAINLDSMSFSGPNGPDFAVVNTQSNALANPCPSSLAAGANCRVIVSFKPTTAIGATETAALALTTGSGTTTQTSLPVNGLVTAGSDITQIAGCSLSNTSGCQAALGTAFASAVTFYKNCVTGTGTGGNYTVVMPAGTFDFSEQVSNSSIGDLDLSGIFACNGAFVLSGAGSALTTIYNNNVGKTIAGNQVNNLTIQGIAFRRTDQTGLNGLSMSQGKYISDKLVNGLDVLTVNILPGYPSPADVWNAYGTSSAYIKAYNNSNISDPVIDTEEYNGQMSFGGVEPTCTTTNGTTQCLVTLDKGFVITSSIYAEPNNITCFKMESSQAYLLNDTGLSGTQQGNNVGFMDVYWYDSARGAFRNINHSFVTYSAIKRRAPTAAMNGQAGCFAAWAGGPQFGQPSDPLITGITLDHFVSEGTADETTELFNEDPNEPAGGSVVSNVTMHTSFGGDVVLDNACGITFDWTGGTYGTPLNQTLTNCDTWQGGGVSGPILSLPQVNGVPTYGACVQYYQGTVSCGNTLVNAHK